MARTQFQPGPSQDHYHDTLGVDEAPQGGVTFPVSQTGAADTTVNLSLSATASGGVGIGRIDRTITTTGTASGFAHTTVTAAGEAEARTTVSATGIQDANAPTIVTAADGNANVTRTADVTTVGTNAGSASANTNASSAGSHAYARTSVVAGGLGQALADNQATSVNGPADGGSVAYATGTGNALVNNLAIVDGAGLATATIEANGPGAKNGYVKVVADATSARIGFFNAIPVAKPTGVAVTAADIHAALVSLGLIAP